MISYKCNNNDEIRSYKQLHWMDVYVMFWCDIGVSVSSSSNLYKYNTITTKSRETKCNECLWYVFVGHLLNVIYPTYYVSIPYYMNNHFILTYCYNCEFISPVLSADDLDLDAEYPRVYSFVVLFLFKIFDNKLGDRVRYEQNLKCIVRSNRRQ